MKINARYITLLLCFFQMSALFSQRDIEPRLVFSDTSSFQFTGEWQYLSTDIYLMNGERFSNVINELDFVRNQPRKSLFRKKGLAEEYLEYLFITANLKNIRFFGNTDLTYPLYNFQISRDKENKYRTYVSDNIDHIRIIDNLPLYAASNFIDAEIKVKAITNSDKDQVLSLIASQLKNISKIVNPTDAILGIIGEFGNFIESSTRRKEYRFSSTIRLFEQKNFDTRIHSLKVYALTTSNSSDFEINPDPLCTLIDTIGHAELTKQILAYRLSFTEYPLIVVVNYKSLYKMEQLTGDEVNFANIEKRRLKIENDYRLGLINSETYRQEKDFINFLTVFANLKNHLDVYGLNYKTGNGDAIKGSLFRILQYYRQLLRTFKEAQYKYRGNSAFQAVFGKEYESITGFASLYLDEDHNLKSLKDLVNTLVLLEEEPRVTGNDLEATLKTLRFSDVLKYDQYNQSAEGQLIEKHLSRIEEDLYRKVYESEVQLLEKTEANSTNKEATHHLKSMLQNTSCLLCRNKGFVAINHFDERMQEYFRQKELTTYDSLAKIFQPWIYEHLEKLQLIGNHLKPGGEEKSSESSKYLSKKFSEAERDIMNIQDLLKVNIQTRDYNTIASVNTKLIEYKQTVEGTANLICQLKPSMCTQGDSDEEESGTTSKELGTLFAYADSVVRQTNIFIAIFDFQLTQAKSMISIQPDNSKGNQLIIKTEQTLVRLKDAVALMESIKTNSDTYRKLEDEINLLINDTSDYLGEITNRTNSE